jgi:hypothetical protein
MSERNLVLAKVQNAPLAGELEYFAIWPVYQIDESAQRSSILGLILVALFSFPRIENEFAPT